MVYTRLNLTSLDVTPPSTHASTEQVWVKLSSNILLIGLYVPPNLSAPLLNAIKEEIVDNADTMLEKQTNIKIILGGDLNQLSTASLERDLRVKNLVDLPTRSSSTLDKVLVDVELVESYFPPIIAPNLGNSDHHVVLLNSRETMITVPTIHRVYDYRESNLNEFLKIISDYPWHQFYMSSLGVNEKCELFTEILKNAMSCIPYDSVPMSPKDKPWITPVIKILINKRYEAFRQKRYDLYQHYKRKVKEAIERSKHSWISSTATNPRGLWKVVDSITNKRRAGQMDRLISSLGSPEKAAEEINSQFAKSFVKTINLVNLEPCENEIKWTINITISDVFCALCKLNVKKATGSDGIPPRLLKLAAPIIAAPLAHLFCLSISTETFPAQWKIADVVPVPKKSNPRIDDLRPISKLPVCSKILEKLVLDSVKPLIIALYGENQFGFRPNTSTLHAHISIQEFITTKLDDPLVIDILMISFDMSKAFDKLDHPCLMKTLHNSNLPKNFIDWCQSYLSFRRQRVVLNSSTKSKFVPVTSGVPQGSVLAPFLFAAHMGSLSPLSSHAHMIKYADDVVTLLPLTKKSDVHDILHSEISHMEKWCSQHGLVLNLQKTQILDIMRQTSITHAHSIPTPCSEVKILGITYESRLKWNSEIAKRCKKASQRLYVLRQLKPSMTKADLIVLYNGFIRSTLEYCCPILIGLTRLNSNLLEKVQRRAHKIICGSSCPCDSFESLGDRRTNQALKCFLAMGDKTHVLHHLHPQLLSSGKRFSFPVCRTSRRANSFIPLCIALLQNV